MPAAAFFDLDKTILSRSSALAFARPLYSARMITRRDVALSAWAQLTLVTGRVDHAAMERMREALSRTVAGWSADTLRRLIAEQLDDIVTPLVFDEAHELIRRHQRTGDEVVIVTSTGTDMAEPIGTLLGVDQVLGTRMVESDGRYTGEIADYMYGPRKAEAIRAWADDRGLDLTDCAAYSDSITDLPMLLAVGAPQVVNPDRDLRRYATDHGWPVHDFGRRVRTPEHRMRQALPVFALTFGFGLAGWGVARRRHRRTRN